eukprot:414317-Rhodomonas_salina.4
MALHQRHPEHVSIPTSCKLTRGTFSTTSRTTKVCFNLQHSVNSNSGRRLHRDSWQRRTDVYFNL